MPISLLPSTSKSLRTRLTPVPETAIEDGGLKLPLKTMFPLYAPGVVGAKVNVMVRVVNNGMTPPAQSLVNPGGYEILDTFTAIVAPGALEN